MNTRLLFILPAALFVLGACSSPARKLAKRRKYIQHTYTDFRKALNDADVSLLNDTVRILFKNPVVFDFNQATILPDVLPTMERMAHVLREHNRTDILIVGHTDSVGGNNSNNQQLSLRRADSARNVLAYYRVQRKRMDTWGIGAKEPVASNATEAGRARNRRVEFIILNSYGKSAKNTN